MVHVLEHILVMSLVMVALGVVAGALFDTYEAIQARRRQRHKRSTLDYERYRAEEAIRSIKRRAIHEMLTAERAHRYAYDDPDIIVGTAVEVRR